MSRDNAVIGFIDRNWHLVLGRAKEILGSEAYDKEELKGIAAQAFCQADKNHRGFYKSKDTSIFYNYLDKYLYEYKGFGGFIESTSFVQDDDEADASDMAFNFAAYKRTSENGEEEELFGQYIDEPDNDDPDDICVGLEQELYA